MYKSVKGKIWKQRDLNENSVNEISRKFGLSDFLSRIIISRINNLEEVADFISPKIKNLLPDPFHLMDMDKAIKRSIEAILLKQKICIFADYDVDGATSASLLKNIFGDLGLDIQIYVPDRISEGYGPTREAMQKIRDNGTDLVITVDCGSVAHIALSYAKNIGLDVIVIDHHVSTDSLPDAIAVINPNRIDETSAYKYLAAVGVSFLFSVALISSLRKSNYFELIKEPNLLQYLDLVALGTVCDVMLITDLNRCFVYQGLKIMQQRQNIGLTALCDLASLSEKPNTYHLGFIIGPRINAGGRVGNSSLGARLLSTKCQIEALKIAEELEKHNNDRKVIELNNLEEAIKIAKMQENEKFLFIVGKDWHVGVIGIIASRLKDLFNKPVAVIAFNEDIGKASCRSIKDVDFGIKIIEAKNAGLLLEGGGHAMAAGFSVRKDRIDDLRIFLSKLFEKDFNKTSKNQAIDEYDMELNANGINFNLMQEIAKLEPYGNGNIEPIFKFSNLFVLKANIFGDKHISCILANSRENHYSSGKVISAIAFNAVGTEIEQILLSKKAHTISALGYLKSNVWQDQYKIQLHIRDLII